MGSALKHNTDYSQGIYEVSSTAQAPLGATLDLGDGRVFRYGQAGALALSAGHLCAAAASTAVFQAMALNTPSIGTKVINCTPGAGTATKDQFADHYLVINATVANGGGATYKIFGHPAIASSTAFDLTVYDEMWETMAAAATGSIVTHNMSGIVVCPAPPVTALAGVAARDIPIANFGWFQIKGICGVLTSGTLIAGEQVIAGGAAGAVTPVTTTYDEPYCPIGRCHTVSATTLFSTIDLNII